MRDVYRKIVGIGIPLIVMIMTPVVCVSMYWLFWPYHVMDLNTETFEILTPIVKAGENVMFAVDVTQYTEGVKVTNFSQIECGTLVNYPTTEYITSKGRMQFTRSVHVPKGMSGICRIQRCGKFDVNPIRNITLCTYTDNFEVIP